MYGKIVAGLAVLAVVGSILGGCKKESPERAEAPQMAPAPTAATPEPTKSGEALFMQHCVACHPNGGNTVTPNKTLHQKVREANGVKTVDDIIMKMRNPGPGMNKFDEKALPDKDSKAIAEYVLNTFK
jgi:cytochrome c6